MLLSKCKKVIEIGKNTLQNPDIQLIKDEIISLEQKLNQIQQFKGESIKELENINKQRKEISSKVMSDGEKSPLRGWMNNRILELQQMDMNRGFQMAQFQIKQRDNYISYLKEQLAQRTKQLMEKFTNTSAISLDENENYTSLHNIEDSISTHLPNLSPNIPLAERSMRRPLHNSKFAIMRMSRASPEISMPSRISTNSKQHNLSLSKIREDTNKCISEMQSNHIESKSRNILVMHHQINKTGNCLRRKKVKVYQMSADKKPINYNMSISLTNK